MNEKHNSKLSAWMAAMLATLTVFAAIGSQASAQVKQSPIDLTFNTKTADKSKPLQFFYQPTSVKARNKIHTVEAACLGDKNFVKTGDTKWVLEQFHFHTPSEHHLNGKEYDMEVHLVHKAVGRTIPLVLGVFLKKGTPNTSIQRIWDLQSPAGKVGDFNPQDLLPRASTYLLSYDGSLTTSGFTAVHWYVCSTPIEVSEKQINDFKGMIEHRKNARGLQALEGRTIRVNGPFTLP